MSCCGFAGRIQLASLACPFLPMNMESSSTAYCAAPERQTCIAREGYPFIAIALGCGLILWITGLEWGALASLGAAGFVAFFFRNPEREVPDGGGLIVAPADGRVLEVTRAPCPCTGREATKVSIFMSVFNVHINRFPVSGTVVDASYRPGKFMVASLDKASEKNERNCLVLADEEGRRLTLVQIAGLIARRIVCYAREGDSLKRGERFGLIRFGSRVDLYLPTEAIIAVKARDRVAAGETIIGRFQ